MIHQPSALFTGPDAPPSARVGSLRRIHEASNSGRRSRSRSVRDRDGRIRRPAAHPTAQGEVDPWPKRTRTAMRLPTCWPPSRWTGTACPAPRNSPRPIGIWPTAPSAARRWPSCGGQRRPDAAPRRRTTSARRPNGSGGRFSDWCGRPALPWRPRCPRGRPSVRPKPRGCSCPRRRSWSWSRSGSRVEVEVKVEVEVQVEKISALPCIRGQDGARSRNRPGNRMTEPYRSGHPPPMPRPPPGSVGAPRRPPPAHPGLDDPVTHRTIASLTTTHKGAISAKWVLRGAYPHTAPDAVRPASQKETSHGQRLAHQR